MDPENIREKPNEWLNPLTWTVAIVGFSGGLGLAILLSWLARSGWSAPAWQLWMYLAYGLVLFVGGEILYLRAHRGQERQAALAAVERERRGPLFNPGDWTWVVGGSLLAVAGVLSSALWWPQDIFEPAAVGILFGSVAGILVWYPEGARVWGMAREIAEAAAARRERDVKV